MNEIYILLDVKVTNAQDHFNTSVYTKPTNVGRCLNANGECSETYKRSVVISYVRRALTHNQEWVEVDRELNRIRQLLTNNGYNGNVIEEIISHQLNKFMSPEAKEKNDEKILRIYHRMTYGTNHDQEEEVLKKIIQRGVEVLEPFERLTLRVFCRPRTTASLIMRNNTSGEKPMAEVTNVVYQFKCPVGACQYRNTTYIGLTTTTLRRRMQAHRNNGGINSHYTASHDRKPLLTELLENTTIVHREPLRYRLNIAEAVHIAVKHPVLNTQKESDYVLPSARRKATTTRRNKPADVPEIIELDTEPQEGPPSNRPSLVETPPCGRRGLSRTIRGASRDASGGARRGAARGATRGAARGAARSAAEAPVNDRPGTSREGSTAVEPADDEDNANERRLRPRRERPRYTE